MEQLNETTQTQEPEKKKRGPKKGFKRIPKLPVEAVAGQEPEKKKRGPKKNPLINWKQHRTLLTDEQVAAARRHFDKLSELAQVESELTAVAKRYATLMNKREDTIKQLEETKGAYQVVAKLTKTM